MIATYANVLNGEGGIVFDAGFGRFLSASADEKDNRKYIQNVAEWLEQNSSSSEKSVLIYNTFHTSGLDNNAFSKNVLPALEQEGFSVKMTDRRETPEVTEQLLGKYNQLWVFFGESGQAPYLSDAELEAISRFAGDGKSMLIVAGKQQDGSNDLNAANRLSSRYGVTYSGFVEHNEELPASTASHFLYRASGILGSVLKFVHKA